MDIYLDASRPGIYTPLFTSPSGDSFILSPSRLGIYPPLSISPSGDSCILYREIKILDKCKLPFKFFSIEKGTENELSYTRELSATRRREIEKLKTELEAEKQNRMKTAQELTELKRHHEISKTETLEQIQKLADLIQQLRGESLF